MLAVMDLPVSNPPRLLIASRHSHELAELETEIAGHEEVTITSGVAELLKMVRKEQFSLIIVAIDMPGLSGSEFIRSLTGGESTPPVLFRDWAQVRALIRRVVSPNMKTGLAFAILSALLDSPHALRTTGAAEKLSSSALTAPELAEEDLAIRKRVLDASFRERDRLLQESLSTQQVAQLLGVTRQTPHDRVKQKALLAIEDKNQQRFPLWQFDAYGANGVVVGLPEVLRALAVGPLAQARWLTTPNRVLEGRTPLQVLKDGEVERVVREARGVGAQAGSAHG